MNRRIFIFMMITGFAAALVPFERRAVNAEEEEGAGAVSTTPATTPKVICAPQTPCGWSIYRPNFKYVIQKNITNTFCVCDVNLECQVHEDDSSVSAFIHLCRPPTTESPGASDYSER